MIFLELPARVRKLNLPNTFSELDFFYKLYRNIYWELYVPCYPPTVSRTLEFLQVHTFIFIDLLSCLDTVDPKGKAPALTPSYRRDARKGYPPSEDLPHAGPEPSSYAPRSFLSGESLDGRGAAFILEAGSMEYESDPPDSEDESINTQVPVHRQNPWKTTWSVP